MDREADAAPPAALHWRLLAALYDLFPRAALWMATAALVLLARAGSPVEPGTAAAWFQFALLVLVDFGYFAWSWRRGGHTLGMRAWRLRLLAADGATPSWAALGLRYAVAALGLAAFGLGFAWSLLDRERRSWHDLASGTRILRLPRR